MSRRPPEHGTRAGTVRVLRSAQQLFATEGLGVPLDEIARRGGVGPGTVHRHSPTKEALFLAVATDQVEQLVTEAAVLVDGEDPAAPFTLLARMMAAGAAEFDLRTAAPMVADDLTADEVLALVAGAFAAIRHAGAEANRERSAHLARERSAGSSEAEHPRSGRSEGRRRQYALISKLWERFAERDQSLETLRPTARPPERASRPLEQHLPLPRPSWQSRAPNARCPSCPDAVQTGRAYVRGVAELNAMDTAVEPAEVAARYRRLAAAMTARVSGVGDSGWEQPSPCDGWTARDVLRHVVEVQSWPLEAAGAGVADIPSSDDDVVAAWDAASSKLAGLLGDADKAAVEIEVAVAGWMSAAAAVNLIVCGDLTVHTWDLARATGQDEHLDPAEVASMRAAVDSIGMEKLRRGGLYSSALVPPPGSDAQTELLAYLGRRAW